MKDPNPPGSGKEIAEGKGVRREAESERSPRQTTDLTYRNFIRRMRGDKSATEDEVQQLPGPFGVNEAGAWWERNRSYPGRPHGRGLPRSKACREESAEVVVGTLEGELKDRT